MCSNLLAGVPFTGIDYREQEFKPWTQKMLIL